ncbi:MAG: hypothetical protein AAF487_02190 [Bacteroidota bacterium]
MYRLKAYIAILFFAAMSLLCSMQLTLNQHFCCNQLVNISILSTDLSCCEEENGCRPDADEKGGCCSDTEIVFEAFQFISEELPVSPEASLRDQEGLEMLFDFQCAIQREALIKEVFSPPDKFGQLLFGVYRI